MPAIEINQPNQTLPSNIGHANTCMTAGLERAELSAASLPWSNGSTTPTSSRIRDRPPRSQKISGIPA